MSDQDAANAYRKAFGEEPDAMAKRIIALSAARVADGEPFEWRTTNHGREFHFLRPNQEGWRHPTEMRAEG